MRETDQERKKEFARCIFKGKAISNEPHSSAHIPQHQHQHAARNTQHATRNKYGIRSKVLSSTLSQSFAGPSTVEMIGDVLPELDGRQRLHRSGVENHDIGPVLVGNVHRRENVSFVLKLCVLLRRKDRRARVGVGPEGHGFASLPRQEIDLLDAVEVVGVVRLHQQPRVLVLVFPRGVHLRQLSQEGIGGSSRLLQQAAALHVDDILLHRAEGDLRRRVHVAEAGLQPIPLSLQLQASHFEEPGSIFPGINQVIRRHRGNLYAILQLQRLSIMDVDAGKEAELRVLLHHPGADEVDHVVLRDDAVVDEGAVRKLGRLLPQQAHGRVKAHQIDHGRGAEDHAVVVDVAGLRAAAVVGTEGALGLAGRPNELEVPDGLHRVHVNLHGRPSLAQRVDLAIRLHHVGVGRVGRQAQYILPPPLIPAARPRARQSEARPCVRRGALLAGIRAAGLLLEEALRLHVLRRHLHHAPAAIHLHRHDRSIAVEPVAVLTVQHAQPPGPIAEQKSLEILGHFALDVRRWDPAPLQLPQRLQAAPPGLLADLVQPRGGRRVREPFDGGWVVPERSTRGRRGRRARRTRV
eukprot:scaffold58_cov256-Pinguiococcus_pyrenoidosus.AAC.15